jgi:hypothetical protein
MSVEHLTQLILEYRYFLLIPLTFIEGPMVGFITGALSKLGYFDPFVAFWIFIIRDVLVMGCAISSADGEGTPHLQKDS